MEKTKGLVSTTHLDTQWVSRSRISSLDDHLVNLRQGISSVVVNTITVKHDDLQHYSSEGKLL